ncbi:MAG: lysozyme [Erythrobacter sp.]|jgi:GH24 family phage-related lysozyme (muramidase)|nr:lysozyme [Erythrobacter sp.]
MNRGRGEEPPRRAAEAPDRVRQIIQDLAVPLESDRAATRLATGGGAIIPPLDDAIDRRTLDRARQAARRAFGVTPNRRKRKAAAGMLAASAVGLTAFAGPNLGAAPEQSAFSSYLEETRQPAAKLTVSEEFRQALIEEEGVRHTVYRDVAGNPTVGVGHLVRPADGLSVGDRVSERQVQAFLSADLAHAERAVRDLVGDLPLFQHEFDALVDLVFNVGEGGVSADSSPQLNAAIEAGDYEGIAAELDYHHAGGELANGLVNRSERRANIFLAANYEDPREMGTRLT